MIWAFHVGSHSLCDWTCPLEILPLCFKVTLDGQSLTISHCASKKTGACKSLPKELSRGVVGNTVGTVNMYYCLSAYKLGHFALVFSKEAKLLL
jgi:hypothetical protein